MPDRSYLDYLDIDLTFTIRVQRSPVAARTRCCRGSVSSMDHDGCAIDEMPVGHSWEQHRCTDDEDVDRPYLSLTCDNTADIDRIVAERMADLDGKEHDDDE